MSSASPTRSLLLVVCGPAGSGKTTLCDRLRQEFPNLRRVITTTTRPPRLGEHNGVDYHFLSKEAFSQKVQQGEFLEWAQVHANRYGTQRADVLGPLQEGHDLLLNIDVQGAEAYRQLADKDPVVGEGLHTVFIRPQSLEQLEERLKLRGDAREDIIRRLDTARRELEQIDRFDSVIVSTTRDDDYRAFREVYLVAKGGAGV